MILRLLHVVQLSIPLQDFHVDSENLCFEENFV